MTEIPHKCLFDLQLHIMLDVFTVVWDVEIAHKDAHIQMLASHWFQMPSLGFWAAGSTLQSVLARKMYRSASWNTSYTEHSLHLCLLPQLIEPAVTAGLLEKDAELQFQVYFKFIFLSLKL